MRMMRKRRFASAMLALILLLGPTVSGLAETTEGFIPDSVAVTEYYVRDESASGSTSDDGLIIDGMVFGSDDREVIDNTDEYPFCAVAYMEAHYPCGCEKSGTGFMVERNKLMTAAHCMVCCEHSQWADQIEFYFGFRDFDNYSYLYDGKWYAFVGDTFPNKTYTSDNDWAVVKLYKNIGDIVGWFGFSYNMPNKQITSKEMLLLGYKWGTLRISEGKAKAGSGDLITYQIDAEAGNSGGPVFYLDNGVPYAAAIHVADNKQNNYGYRITGEMYSKFMELDDY